MDESERTRANAGAADGRKRNRLDLALDGVLSLGGPEKMGEEWGNRLDLALDGVLSLRGAEKIGEKGELA